MLREYAFLWRIGFILVDLGVTSGAFLAAYWLRLQPPVSRALGEPVEMPPVEAYAALLPAICVIFFFTNSYFRLYQARRISRFTSELLDIVKSNAVAILMLTTFLFLNRSFSYSRSVVALFAALNPLCVFALRVGIRVVLRALRAHGYNLRHILIIGTGRPAQALLHRIRRNPWTGLRAQGFVSLKGGRAGREIHGLPVAGSVDDINEVLARHRVSQVFIALPLHERRAIERLLEELSSAFVAIRMVPDLGFLLNHRVTMDFDGMAVVNLWENHLTASNAFAKRILDLVLAAAGLVVLLPVMAAIAVGLKLSERGPVLYAQRRMGLDGRVFSMLKFRTMRPGAEDDHGFTQPGDERCTRAGRFLRRTSLDELPQLFNVLLGQMSLVGPRPERPVFIESFRKEMPRYMLRHKAKAGMTGWAQINGWRGATSLKKRLQYDLYYLHNWSLGFDLKILLLTLVRGWMHRNAY